MKVLFIQHGFGYGGATKSLHLMQQSLSEAVDIFTIVKKNKKLNKIIGKEFIHSKKIIEMSIPGVYSYSEGTISENEFKKNIEFYPKEIIDFINVEKIDILHINSSVFSNLLSHIKKNTACRIIVHFREMLPFGKSNQIDEYILNNTLKYADQVISISPNELIFFPESDKLKVLPNPHDFNSTDILLKKSISNGNKVIVGMCSNFIPIKGHLIFIEAIRLVMQSDSFNNQDVEFRIIGYPKNEFSIKGLIKRFVIKDYKKKIDTLIRKYKLKNIKLIPFTFDVLKEISELDIYIRPDLSGNPWGRDIIEAMALKKPIIATGSSEYYVNNTINGFLIQENNKEELASKIVTLILNKKLRVEMGYKGYEIVKDKCDFVSYRDKLLDVYKTL